MSKLEDQSEAAASMIFTLLTPASLIAAGALADAFVFIMKTTQGLRAGKRAGSAGRKTGGWDVGRKTGQVKQSDGGKFATKSGGV